MSIGLNANNDGSGSVQTAGNDAIVISATQNVTIPNNLTITGTTTFSGGVSGNIKSGTAVASTSGTSIDFTGIPSTAKRITVMFNVVSTSGTSPILVQIGATTITTSGYSSGSGAVSTITAGATGGTSSAAGFVIYGSSGAGVISGAMVITVYNGTTYLATHTAYNSGVNNTPAGSGISPSIGAAIDRVRITTTNGTDTFDAGSVNILWE